MFCSVTSQIPGSRDEASFMSFVKEECTPAPDAYQITDEEIFTDTCEVGLSSFPFQQRLHSLILSHSSAFLFSAVTPLFCMCVCKICLAFLATIMNQRQ
jgi:hypothetical protein